MSGDVNAAAETIKLAILGEPDVWGEYGTLSQQESKGLDALDALVAEVESLRASVEHIDQHRSDLMGEIAELRAERDAARDALGAVHVWQSEDLASLRAEKQQLEERLEELDATHQAYLAHVNEVDACERRLQEALATAALPLEVLRAQIKTKAYKELTHDLQVQIVAACDTIRAALTATDPDEA